jgi:hypothetical protein
MGELRSLLSNWLYGLQYHSGYRGTFTRAVGMVGALAGARHLLTFWHPPLPEGKEFLRGQLGCSFGGFLLLPLYFGVHFTG